MVTRLSQRKVKSTDPAYASLKEQMEARLRAEGTGYVMPVGGIPRGDMTTDVQEALLKADKAYITPVSGIPETDMEESIIEALILARSAYQRPEHGIVAEDLEQSIQDRLNDFSNFYVIPSTGIPAVDMDQNVRGLLDKADSAYQKPVEGIPESDFNRTIQDKLSKADSAYQKPDGGIPAEDLAEAYALQEDLSVLQSELEEYIEKYNEVVDHADLENTGEYTHDQIDTFLDQNRKNITDIFAEIKKARAGFIDLDRRITSSLFRSNGFLIEGSSFNQGTFDNLTLSLDGNIRFPFTPTPFPIKTYDQRSITGWSEDNYITTEHSDDLDILWPEYISYYKDTQLAKDIGIVIEGFLYAPVSGTYKIGISATGHYTLKVNKTTLEAPYRSDVSFYHNQNHAYAMDIELTGGQFYPFTLIGTNTNTVNSRIRISWLRPDKNLYQVIDKEYFSFNGFNSDNTGVYTTQVIDTNEIYIRQWALNVDHDLKFHSNMLSAEFRSSNDNETFTEWSSIEIGKDYFDCYDRYMQFRITTNRSDEFRSPVIKGIQLSYVSTANEFFREIQEARGVFVTLKDQIDNLNQLSQDAVDLASAVNHGNVHPEWLENVRFEHLDINMLRLHWYQLQKTEDPPHILPSGYVDDFHDDSMIDSRSSQYEIKESKVFPLPYTKTFETNADWYEWDRRHTTPIDGQLQLVDLDEDDDSNSTTKTIVDIPQNTVSTSQRNTSQQTLIQAFYLDENMYRVSRVRVHFPGGTQYGGSGSNYSVTSELYLVPSDENGDPDESREIFIARSSGNGRNGIMRQYQGNWAVDEIGSSFRKNNKTKVFVKMITGNLSTYKHIHYYQQGNASIANKYLNADDSNEDMRVRLNGSPQNQRYMVVQVDGFVGYRIRGEAQKIIDFGENVHFVNDAIDASFNQGTLTLEYSSSNDNQVYSEPTYDIQSVPNGRYLKILATLERSEDHRSPLFNALTIRYLRNDIVFQSKIIEVPRIPTHVIIDAKDSGNNDIYYQVSRNAGIDFIDVTPGVQTDVRSIPPGREMVVRMLSDRGKQHDNVWIDYIGLQTITHEDFSPSNIVAHHQEVIAEAGQTEFHVTRPYPMGDHSLQVFVNGSYQIVNTTYEETNETTVTFLEPLRKGDIVIFRVAAGAYRINGQDGLAGAVQQIGNDLILLENTVSSHRKDHEDLNDLVQTQGESLADHDSKLVDHENQLNEHSDDLINISNELIQVNQKIDDLESHTNDEIIRIETLIGDEKTALETLIDDRTTAIDSELQLVSSTLDQLDQTDVNIQTEITSIQAMLDTMKKDIEEVKALMAIGEQEFLELVGRVDDHDQVISDLQSSLTTVNQKLDNMLSDISGISDRVGYLESNQLNLAISNISFDDLDEDPQTTGIQVTQNLILPEKTANGATIQWSSLTPDWISNSGIITRPSYTEGNKTATLRAVVTYANESKTKDYQIIILATPPNDEEKVNQDLDALSLDHIDVRPTVEGLFVDGNITLPTKGEIYQSTIQWSSSHPDHISSNGVVNRPAYNQSNIIVTLQATITSGNASVVKSFEITVIKAEATDENKVFEDLNALPALPSETTDNLSLVTEGSIYGSSIQWISSDDSIINSNGVVTRPLYSEGSKQVTLTAIVTNGSATDDKVYQINVLAEDIIEPRLVNVMPADNSDIALETGESFILEITAEGSVLRELEVDHNVRHLPEFSVYADPDNPFGSPESKANFESHGVDISYNADTKMWRIDFGDFVTNELMSVTNLRFHFVVKDQEGNEWGSMDPTTEENTFNYTVSRVEGGEEV